jgi:hypothetical protein
MVGFILPKTLVTLLLGWRVDVSDAPLKAGKYN